MYVLAIISNHITEPKLFGEWKNEGKCIATAPEFGLADCGPGTQLQKRTCTDGTVDKCTEADSVQRTVTCAAAGSELGACKGDQIIKSKRVK